MRGLVSKRVTVNKEGKTGAYFGIKQRDFVAVFGYL